MGVASAGAIYYAAVFGAGFALGPLRVLWLEPYLGEVWAELVEAPLMLAAIALAAHWTVRRLAEPRSLLRRLATGLIGLVLLLATEMVAVLLLRGLTLADYLAARDPRALAVYAVLLSAFALMPLAVGRR